MRRVEDAGPRSMSVAPWTFGRAVSALRRAGPFLKMALQNRDWIEQAVKEREFVRAKIAEKAAAEAKLAAFRAEFDDFARRCGSAGRPLTVSWDDVHPCLDDRTADTPFDRHYLYHPAWAARVLSRTRPRRHVDISSIVSFSAIISAFIPVDFFDFRPADIRLSDFKADAVDLLRLPFADNSIESLSCMHVLEHVGLGRYGDPMDPDGDLKAIRELTRVLARGGTLLVAVPVGKPCIAFNAHRIYDHAAFRDHFAGMELVEFALIRQHASAEGLILDPPDELVRAESYGCGCYWFRKP
jgi:hypothetical protein